MRPFGTRKRPALHPLHGDPGLVVADLGVKEGHHAGQMEVPERGDLAANATGVAGAQPQALEGHDLAAAAIDRLPDLAKAAAAEEARLDETRFDGVRVIVGGRCRHLPRGYHGRPILQGA
jgi:hypothetical protein